jgi:hypothetical protein
MDGKAEMPAAYESIKESLRKQHPEYSEAELKTHAAKIYNASAAGQKDPVGPHYDEAHKIVEKHHKGRKKRGNKERQVKAAEEYLSRKRTH